MIVARGVVLGSAGPERVWVETRRESGCDSCSARAGCGSALIGKALGARAHRVAALAAQPLAAGERVELGLEEGALLVGSLAVYGLPLLGLLLGAIGGELALGGASEAPLVALGALGFAAGLAGGRRFSRRIGGERRWQPVVLRRL